MKRLHPVHETVGSLSGAPVDSPIDSPIDSIVRMASRLVTTPSCAGVDSPQPVLSLVRSWLAENGLAPRLLDDPSGKPVAVLVEIAGAAPGPVLCLDACIDT